MRFNSAGLQTILAYLMLIATAIMFTDFSGVGATTYLSNSIFGEKQTSGAGEGGVLVFDS